MLKITQIRLRPEKISSKDQCMRLLKKKAAAILGIPQDQILSLEICKYSIDARRKPDVFYEFSVKAALPHPLEKKLCGKKRPNVSLYQERSYQFPAAGTRILSDPPVIVGTGPAGLFCGYYLALFGYRPILLERGARVEQRIKDVEAFWKKGRLDPESNVQFGEGGAGTFSDGKLNTMIRDPAGRQEEVLRCFVENGAPKEILWDSRPHLGTDQLTGIVAHMRDQIIRMGGQVRFSSCVTDLVQKDGVIQGVEINGREILSSEVVVLAPGHSARDTFLMLHGRNIPMESKSFAVGVRIEHSQKMINERQYGVDCPGNLPAASYKVAVRTAEGRGVYSFCMCPGGYVVNASSEQEMLAVNGMSYQSRDGKNGNSAMIVTVTPDDYAAFQKELKAETLPEPLMGVSFQRALERRAYAAGGGKIPVQRFEDFQNHVKTTAFGSLRPETKGEFCPADVRSIFPEVLGNALEEGIHLCGKKIRGFDQKDALLSGVESRTSSPVRILRGEDYQSRVKGLYPCGEGAGYAGGITSAAIDGLKIAEAIGANYSPFLKKQTENGESR